MSFATLFVMSSFTLTFKPATCVVESLVGEVGTVPTPPRPNRPRNSFTPFRPYEHSHTTPLHIPSDRHCNSFHPYRRHLPKTHNPVTISIAEPSPLVPLTSSQNLPLPPVPQSSSLSLVPTSSSSRLIRPRKPQPGRSIEPNPLRPHVAAADRIFSWDTPFAARHRKYLASKLPPALVDRAMAAIRGALAPNTKNTYGASPMRFTQFCDTWKISEEDRMPASYALLCAFIGEHKGRQTGNAICSWMSGIRSWHIVNHPPWYGDDEWVHLARISANKEGAIHKRPLHAPVSIEHLCALHRAIRLSDPLHAAVWAVALCTFFGCRRLGETTVTTGSAFDEKYHVLRSATYAARFVCLLLF